MDRRKFIKNACAACISTAALGSLMYSCTATHYITGKLGEDGLFVSMEEFKVNKNGVQSYRPFLIVRNDALTYPVCVYRWSESEYTALWMRCSHQGAELLASGDFLQCPAHGSEFNNKGKVTNGPADKDLRTFDVTVGKNELFIDMRKK